MPIDASGKTIVCPNCGETLQHDFAHLYCANNRPFCDTVTIDDAVGDSLVVPDSLANDLIHIYEETVTVPAPREMDEIWFAINYAYMGKPRFDSLEEAAAEDHEEASCNVRMSITTTLYVGVRTSGERIVLGVKRE